MNVNERNKQIKKALLKSYDAKNVSVRGDRGTAYGWVKVKVSLDRPEGCQCNWKTEFNSWTKKNYTYRAQLSPIYMGENGSTYMCKNCLNKHVEETKKIEKIVYGCGAEFYHYYADDGYNTEHAEVLIDVEVK